MIGGALSFAAVVLAARRVALLQWNGQKAWENLDLVDVVDATAHDDPGAAERLQQAAERERLRTGRSEPEPEKSLTEFRKQEFGLPIKLAAAGIFISTTASVLSLWVA